jgi:hypothetical protein
LGKAKRRSNSSREDDFEERREIENKSNTQWNIEGTFETHIYIFRVFLFAIFFLSLSYSFLLSLGRTQQMYVVLCHSFEKLKQW